MKKTLTIIKIGGKVVESPALLNPFIQDFSTIKGSRILVHGGGKSATELAKKLGIEAPMVNGRRITSDEMLEVAMMVYGGLVSKKLTALLQAKGVNAIGMTGADMDVIRAHKRPVKEIDYGWAGDIDQVNASALDALIQQGLVPVLAPLTHNGKGQMLNTNADTIASTVAQSMASLYEVRLIYCFEKAGVLADPEDEDSVIPRIDPQAYQQYKDAGVIAGGMIPKLDNAFHALNHGVHSVFICSTHNFSKAGSPSFHGTVLFDH